MPRKARIDAPGALHHQMARGIERRSIFMDNQDRDDFLERLGNIVAEYGTPCYAWSLVPNHFHVRPDKIVGPGKSRDVVMARSLICYWGSKELGLTMTRVAGRLGISVPAGRGERIAADNRYSFAELLNVKI